MSVEHEGVDIANHVFVAGIVLEELGQRQDGAVGQSDGDDNAISPVEGLDNTRGGAHGVDIPSGLAAALSGAGGDNVDNLVINLQLAYVSGDIVVGNGGASNDSVLGAHVAHDAGIGIEGHNSIAILGGGVVDEVTLIFGVVLVTDSQAFFDRSNLLGVLEISLVLIAIHAVAVILGGFSKVNSVDTSVGAAVDIPDTSSVVHHVEAGISLNLHANILGGIVSGNLSGAGAHALVVNDDALGILQMEDILTEGAFAGVAISEFTILVDVITKSLRPHNLLYDSEGIKGIEHSLLALKGDMVGAGGVAGEEADGVSDASGVEGPGVAGELTVSVEADSGEEHFGPLEAGEGTGGFEGGVGHTVDNTLFDAEGDVTGGPAVSGDIVEGSDGAGEGVGGSFTEDHVSDDLGSLLTGVGSGGVDGSLGHTVNDFETGHDANGLDIGLTDVLSVGVIVELVISGSADDTEAEDHHEGENESQRLL